MYFVTARDLVSRRRSPRLDDKSSLHHDWDNDGLDLHACNNKYSRLLWNRIHGSSYPANKVRIVHTNVTFRKHKVFTDTMVGLMTRNYIFHGESGKFSVAFCLSNNNGEGIKDKSSSNE